MASLNSFEELQCWKKARTLRNKVRGYYIKFPSEEKYLLVDQLKRATRSVTANIAEGFGRFHYLENSKFCRISRGSLTEILDHLIAANDEGYISDEELVILRIDIQECLIILNGYINYLVTSNKKPTRTNSIGRFDNQQPLTNN
jgi:four helix bundle protein